MLKEIASKTQTTHGHCKLTASDFMDDGSRIQLTVDIDPTQVTALHFGDVLNVEKY